MPTEAKIYDSPTGWVRKHIEAYVESDGQQAHQWGGLPTLLLTTRGRKSGKLRRTALIYGRAGENYLLVASNGGAPNDPFWYLNLVENPEVEIQVGADKIKARGMADKVKVIGILTYLVILVTMVYGPIAAMLVEMFPTRIRYTSMSLPYHIGNGWFGGLLPTTAFAIVAQTGNMYNGLWYPIIIAGMTFVVGMLFVRETKDVDIYAND